MKIDFIVISGILVIISFLPFILLPVLGMKDHKNLLHSFKETSLTMGLNISFKLQWNTNIAGIDILKKQFLFIQKPENDLLISRVNLNEVNEVKLAIQNCELKLQDKVMQTLSRIDLQFYTHNSTEPVLVNVFDYDLNYTEDLEIKNAQKLLVELQKYIIAKPILRHSA
ncbi:MAG: hypothetical protein ABJ092_10490 [Gillisia sp.]